MDGQSRKKRGGITGSGLKVIAMVSMLVDHCAFTLVYPFTESDVNGTMEIIYYIMRTAGRLAFPIFAFLLAEGFIHTSDKKKYLLRLGIFALLSEIPYDLMVSDSLFGPHEQNVFFTLFIGLFVLIFLEKWKGNYFLQGIVMVAGVMVSWLIKADYGGFGVLLIAVFYELRSYRKEFFIVSTVICLCMMQSVAELAYLAALPLIAQYNGMRGRKLGYLPYAFYPLHILFLTAVRNILILGENLI